MIQLKLKLNSKKSTTVYATNGKSYLLSPGSNVLNLEYEDYLSLAKALCIKPVDNKKNEDEAPAKEDKKSEIKDTPKEEPADEQVEDTKEEAPAESEKVEEPADEPVEDTKVEEPTLNEKPAAESETTEEPVEEAKAEEVDYSTWTLKQLKAKYKEITGESCKLKKDEVISFLQEHQSNA
jgi:hypothetical protein